jgi:REP element-mobilizing transposase RayT
MLAINGMPDHIHMLFGYRDTQLIPELIQYVKGYSSKWINENRFCPGQFRWQEGYGGFAVARQDLDRYIKGQEAHHNKISFREEFLRILKEQQIEFDEKYLFHNPIEHEYQGNNPGSVTPLRG